MDFTRTDGRNVGWAEYGDPAGRPVVLLHGTPGSRLAHPDLEALSGHRVITLDRPGYGRSQAPARPTLLDTADAVADLMTSLAYERFGVIGFSGGAPYALACGARLPDRVTGVVAAGMTGPDRELGTLPGRQRVLVWWLRALPPLGRRYVHRAAAGYDAVAHQRELVAAGGDPYMDRSEESNVESARQGVTGLVADWLATDIHRWGFRLRDVRPPVLIWAGRGDPGRAVPDAPLMAARLPRAEVRIADDVAHTPSPSDWRTMLTWLSQHTP
jgi:pimeloyl-ACP methyl ester carboxylesterase